MISALSICLVFALLLPASLAQDGKIYTVSDVHIKPEPSIGLKEFQNRWSRKVTYPEEALERKIQGMVFVEFIVNPDSTVTNAAIRSGLGYGCDEAALEAFIELSQDGWKPGIKDEQAVKVKMVLPFYFRIL